MSNFKIIYLIILVILFIYIYTAHEDQKNTLKKSAKSGIVRGITTGIILGKGVDEIIISACTLCIINPLVNILT